MWGLHCEVDLGRGWCRFQEVISRRRKGGRSSSKPHTLTIHLVSPSHQPKVCKALNMCALHTHSRLCILCTVCRYTHNIIFKPSRSIAFVIPTHMKYPTTWPSHLTYVLNWPTHLTMQTTTYMYLYDQPTWHTYLTYPPDITIRIGQFRNSCNVFTCCSPKLICYFGFTFVQNLSGL